MFRPIFLDEIAVAIAARNTNVTAEALLCEFMANWFTNEQDLFFRDEQANRNEYNCELYVFRNESQPSAHYNHSPVRSFYGLDRHTMASWLQSQGALEIGYDLNDQHRIAREDKNLLNILYGDIAFCLKNKGMTPSGYDFGRSLVTNMGTAIKFIISADQKTPRFMLDELSRFHNPMNQRGRKAGMPILKGMGDRYLQILVDEGIYRPTEGKASTAARFIKLIFDLPMTEKSISVDIEDKHASLASHHTRQHVENKKK
jgi:hypothetical protein